MGRRAVSGRYRGGSVAQLLGRRAVRDSSLVRRGSPPQAPFLSYCLTWSMASWQMPVMEASGPYTSICSNAANNQAGSASAGLIRCSGSPGGGRAAGKAVAEQQAAGAAPARRSRLPAPASRPGPPGSWGRLREGRCRSSGLPGALLHAGRQKPLLSHKPRQPANNASKPRKPEPHLAARKYSFSPP